MKEEQTTASAGTDQEQIQKSQETDFAANAQSKVEISKISDDPRDQTIRTHLSELKISTRITKPRDWLINLLVDEYDCTKKELLRYLRLYAQLHSKIDWNKYAITTAIANYEKRKPLRDDSITTELIEKTTESSSTFDVTSEQNTKPSDSATTNKDASLPEIKPAPIDGQTRIGPHPVDTVPQKPMIIIPPSADRLVDDFAAELAPILSRHGFYNYHGNCVVFERTNRLEDPQLIIITPQKFIGIIERYVAPLMQSRQGVGTYTRFRSLSIETAAATLAHLDFLKALPRPHESDNPRRNRDCAGSSRSG
jgi:hypothetical protein